MGLIGTFWREWEPHLSLWAGIGVLYLWRPSDLVSAIILAATGGPAVRDAIVSVLGALRGGK